MIDFRYHLVSLISVFLALAVGIVLGAGPLREPIADSLQAQVDSLREDRDNLRLDLDEANTTIADADSYVTATAGQLLSDTLTGVNVSLVVSDTVDAATVDAVTARLGEAGGTLVGTTTLRETAFAVAEADELLGTLRGLDPTLPEAEDAALSTAAARALAGPAAPTTAAPAAAEETPPATDGPAAYDAGTAQQVLDAFAAERRITADEPAPADVVLVLAPAGTAGTTGASADDPATEPADGTSTPTATATPDTSGPEARLLFTEALGELAPTAVSGPSTSAADGLIGDLRADGAPVTTVDGLQYTSGPVITALSVASTHQGARDAFGFASAADTVVPDAEALRSSLASTQQADAEGAEGTGEGEQ